MKNVFFIAVCVMIMGFALPSSAKTEVLVSSTDVTTDPPSALEKLANLAKDVKEKTSKKDTSETTDEEPADSSDSTIAEPPADEEAVVESSEDSEDSETSESTQSSSKSSKSTVANIIGDVTGLNKLTEKTLVGTWAYKEPGVGFASESLLAQAGGEIAATACRDALVSAYNSVGITAENTSFVFTDDGSFTAKLAGHSVKGTYTFDADEQTITLKVLVLSLKGHTKRTSDGMSLMFESDKVLDLLEVVCKATGSKTLSAVSSLSSQYDGVQVGFDLSKE